ncbi:hypothetical protein [Halocatena pleomorpha]|uniref:Uncharacterized protein n=1 Tax=Halocatena pleomorpha TaxID=1785090 RepID=A0A3P3RG20_9EURY|nr:hypothetical protein [Halocatena pleomorpha]RRJ31700.1 hypothetical protein EIK79_06485 [Halocatena pleomorpha]
MGKEIVDKLRQPEHTGENRCLPCTVVNVVIAAVGSLIVSRKSRVWGGLAFAGSLACIHLRGYLVPGTPTLTKQYLPAEVLRWFGKDPDDVPVRSGFGDPNEQLDGSSAASPAESEGRSEVTDDAPATTTDLDPDEYFLEIGVLAPCEEHDDLCLTEEFSTKWTEEIERVESADASADHVATAFGIDEQDEEYTIESHDDARILRQGQRMIGQWPSNAALIADVSGTAVLEEFDPQWDERSPNQKGQLLNGLRLFLEDCPGDGGAIEYNEEVVESCCQSHSVLAVTCADSDERLVEFPLDEIEA